MLVMLLILAALAPLPTPQAAQPQAVPNDFKLVAAYSPGFSKARPWVTTIHADGKAFQKAISGARGGEPSEKQFQLIKASLNSLLAKIKEAKFFELQKRYSGAVSDHATIYLEITLNNQTHRVSVYAWDKVTGPENIGEVNRFLSIWLEVLAIIPSPDPDRNEHYQAGVNGSGPKPPEHPKLREAVYAEFVKGRIALDANGKWLAWNGVDGSVRLRDIAVGKQAGIFELGEKDSSPCVAISPDGKALAAGHRNDKSVTIWDVASGKMAAAFVGHSGSVTSVAYSPNGKLIASGSADATIMLWDAATGKQIETIIGHHGAIRFLTFSADGKTLASGSVENYVRLWDIPTGNSLGFLEDMRHVAFSPDGRTLASSDGQMTDLDLVKPKKAKNKIKEKDRDSTVKLWETATRKHRATLEGHTKPVLCLAFSPDGKTLASAGVDERILLWNLATGKVREILPTPGNLTTYLAFSQDGTVLVSGAMRMILVWNVS